MAPLKKYYRLSICGLSNVQNILVEMMYNRFVLLQLFVFDERNTLPTMSQSTLHSFVDKGTESLTKCTLIC